MAASTPRVYHHQSLTSSLLPHPQCHHVITRHLLAFGDDPVSLNEKCVHVDVYCVYCVNVDVGFDDGYIDVDCYCDFDISFVNVYVDFDVKAGWRRWGSCE